MLKSYFGVMTARCVIASLCVLGMQKGAAVEISSVQAQKAVANWLLQGEKPLETKLLGSVRNVETVQGSGTNALFHIVTLKEGGLIVTSADDGIMPIIAFSEDNEIIKDPRNPFWTLLKKDMEVRLALVRNEEINRSNLIKTNLTNAVLQIPKQAYSSYDSAKERWKNLLSEGMNNPSNGAKKVSYQSAGISTISSVRVSPLVKTKWGQDTVGGKNVYNYYTPNNYVCGCVATAAAQLLRKHQYPTTSISPQSFDCWVDSVGVRKTMLGGVYSWASMPEVPSSSITLAQQQAIGKLCYDIGVSSRMSWKSASQGGSGAHIHTAAEAFTNVFKYANSVAHYPFRNLTPDEIERALLCNFDAEFPVILGITDANGGNGHAIVADGYGYNSGVLYCHLNFGWSGNSDAWYNLPNIGTGYNYSIIDVVAYNIFPQKRGDLISGRILDSAGQVVSGATVTVSSDETDVSCTSNEKGIYSVILPGDKNYQVKAQYDNQWGSIEVYLPKSKWPSYAGYNDQGELELLVDSVVGNSWGNDIVIKDTPPNDDFADATLISGERGSIEVSNVGATFETGEPEHNYSSATTSVWWKWTPAKSGSVTFSTEGSSFDTILAVYTGSTLSSLTQYALDDDGGTDNTSICTFEAVAGTTYYIAVAGYNAKTGTIKLSWEQTIELLPNLNFSAPYQEWPQAMFLHNKVDGLEAVYEFGYGETIYFSYGHGNDGDVVLGKDSKALHAIYDSDGVEVSSWLTMQDSFLEPGVVAWMRSGTRDEFNKLSPGSYTYRCTLDVNDDIREIDETDNVWEYEFAVLPPPDVISVVPVSISCNGNGIGINDDYHINVSANCSWKAEVSDEWIKIYGHDYGNGDGRIWIGVEPNLTKDSRFGTITFSNEGGSVKCSVSVTQDGASVQFVIEDGVLIDCIAEGGTEAIIPNSVASIGDSAFYGCKTLTTVVLPGGVTNIGSYAFYECSNLNNIVLPNGVISIGSGAFYGCSSLEEVVIPNGVKEIKYGTFDGCLKLKRVKIPDSVKYIGSKVFDEWCWNLFDESTIKGVRLVDGWCVGYNDELSGALDLTMTRGVSAGAFQDCINLEEVKLPVIESIGSYMFDGCSSLIKVYIPDGVRRLEACSFGDCSSLSSISIPSTVRLLEPNVFMGCSSSLFDKNTIPGIEMVDGWVIKGEKSLSGVLDISNVRGIAGGAFVGCTELTDVVFPNDIESIGNVTFENCTGLTEIVIPSKVVDIGVNVFYGCENLKKVFLPLACKDYINENDVFRGTSGNLQIIYYCNTMIILNANGGELPGELSISTITGVAIGTLPTPTRDGYTFLGWFTAAEGGEQVTADTLVTGDMTLYAQWGLVESLTVSASLVVADDSGKSGLISITANCDWSVLTSDSWITVSPTSGSGNGTLSYTIAANTTVQSRSGTITVTSSGGITRTIAVSQEGFPMYEVAFNPNGGTLSGGATRNIVSGAEIGTLPTPTRDGYTFLGWFTAAEGGERVTADTLVTGDMTLYAQWEEELKEPSFEIDENGVLSSVELNGATEIIIPSNVKVIADEALSGCCDLTSVTIPEGVVSIGYDAFNCCCALISINIPSTVTNIGDNAFGNCTNLRIVTGGEGLKRVGIDAFYDTLFLYGEDSWEDVESNEDYMNDYGLDLVRLGNFIVGRRGSLEEARNDEYYDEEGNWTWEYNLVIPEGTTGMADGLFAGVPITSVEIPGSVKRIPESAFGDCCYLKDLTINEGVEEIGADAFGCAGCNWGEDGITTLSVPSSVAKIGEYAFRSFGNLKYVVGLDDTDDVSMDAFIWTPYVDGWQAPVLNIEDGVVYGYYWETRFDDGCITNGTLYIPEGVTNIAEGAFGYESSFEKVVLPEGVVSIGNSTFSYCAALTSINIPSTVTNIGENAFGNCTNLRIVTGGEGLKRVGIDAFYDTLFLYGEDSWEDVEANEDYANGYGLDLVQLGNFIVGRCGSLAEAMNDEYYDEDGDWMWEYNLVIPEGTSGMADGLFAGVPITSVEIPGSVKRIPESAFGDCCYLKDLIINEGVEEIGAYAFSCAGCNWGEDGITTLVIPLSVTKIEENAFADFGHLKYVTGLNDTDEIHEDAFNGTPYIEGWEAPVLIIEDGVVYGYDWETRFDDGCITNGTLYIPEGVTNVADCAFKEMNEFSKAVLPSSLRSIGHEAFYDCEELREIEGDVNLESVGYDAFYDTLFLYGEDSWEDVEANEDYANGYGLDLVRLGNFIVGRRGSLAEAWNDEYYDEEGNWTWEYNLVIPEGTTGLADGLFADVQITSVEIPGSVKRIPYNAFYSCSYLDELTLDEGIEEIAYGAFEGCSYDEYGIESVVIPSSVKKIGEDAFRECDRLKYVTGIDDTDEIHEDAFMGTPYVEGWEAMILDIEDGNVVGIKWETRFDDGCVTNGTLYIPEGVTNIATSAVSGNSEFCNVNLPDTLQSIGDGAFSCCELLIGVTIPNGVVSIGVDAFESCGLESVFISESVASIGAGAFYSCSHLTNIIIPENVVSIGEEVFAYCDNLTYVRVPLALKTQVEEGNVFADCSPDLQIEYYDNAPLVAPVITPADGTEFYEDSCTVTITCETDGATIYYTTDGTTPRPKPANLYSGPFEIIDTTTVKAIAVKGDERTNLVFATIVKKDVVLAEPVITPADGTEFYEDSCMVTISCATEGASIYYTVCDTNNVTNPRPSERNLYTGPFTVSATKMVRAFSMFGSKTSDIVSATLIKRELTLSVAVDAPALTFTTGGDAQWTPVFDGSAKVGDSLAQSGALSWSETDDDPSETWMETTVAGAGTFSFWWKVDCEDDPWGATWDRFEVYTNGVEAARIDGKTEWEKIVLTFADSRTHTVRWRFYKDDWDDEKLPDIAWVDDVVWTLVSTDITVDVGDGKNVVVPASWIDKYGDILAAADGDKMAALLRTAANGRKVWECFMLGVDPTKADDDFRITRFWMENSKPKFEFSHSVDGAGNSFLSRLKIKGKAKLSDGWADVPPDGDSLCQFFTVEVTLP